MAFLKHKYFILRYFCKKYYGKTAYSAIAIEFSIFYSAIAF